MFFNKNKEEKVKAIHITDENFESTVANATLPILIDFWAPWCGPCKVMGPVVDELAAEYDGKAIIAKVDVDKNPALSGHFKVQSIPTIMLIKNNEVVAYQPGMVPKPNLAEMLDKLIDEKPEVSEEN